MDYYFFSLVLLFKPSFLRNLFQSFSPLGRDWSVFPAVVLSVLRAAGASLNKLWTSLINLIRRLKRFWSR